MSIIGQMPQPFGAFGIFGGEKTQCVAGQLPRLFLTLCNLKHFVIEGYRYKTC